MDKIVYRPIKGAEKLLDLDKFYAIISIYWLNKFKDIEDI